MNWTELSEQQYLDAINGEIPEATTARRIKRLKEQHGSRVKGAKGRLNALAIAPIQWRRYQDAIEAKARHSIRICTTVKSRLNGVNDFATSERFRSSVIRSCGLPVTRI